MNDNIIVVTHSILDQGALPEQRRLSQGALPVVSDLNDLNINLVSLPNLEKHYELFIERELTKEDLASEEYAKYIKSHLVALVHEVMARVKKGGTFLGVLSYGADDSQRVEPESSPIMLSLFRLFDRNCMLTPYFEIPEHLDAEAHSLVIADVVESLGI
ncbi:MAG: hypothetical protein GX829_08540 [Clostridium sp.]|jgi:hypothetical protein|nr:hypothetical protein [Clostridium sp.]